MNKLDEYAKAVIAHQSGDKKMAAEHLAHSIGLESPTVIINGNIDYIMKENTPIHKAMTELIVLATKQVKNDSNMYTT